MDPNRLFQQFFGGQPSYNMFNQGNSYPSGNYNNFHPNQNPSGFGQQYQQYQNPFNANINVNTNYNVHNNYYNEAEDEYDQYPNHQQYQNRNTQQQQQQPKKTQEKFQKKTEEKEAKDPQILQAENNPNSGHYYKKLGNDHFTKGQYQEALKYYTKAIELNDTESIFYSNRARCWKKLGQPKKAYEDAKYAVELDDKNIKAHLLCGQLLAEIGKYEPGLDKINLALNRMTKALTLCAGQQKKEFEKDVQKNIMRVKKLKWYKQQDILKQQKIEQLKGIKALIAYEDHLSKEERDKKYQQIVELMGDPTAPVYSDIPDHLCCKITMELMEDPVITQTGVTYERAALLHHLQKNGNFDPVTREPLDPNHIYPNLAIKQATDEFLNANPWAFEHIHGETIDDIKF